MTNEYLRLWMYRFLSFAAKTENRPPSLESEGFSEGTTEPSPCFRVHAVHWFLIEHSINSSICLLSQLFA